MSQELLYTSAPKGLKPGSRGFCTVVTTHGMSAPLATALESLSAYRQVYSADDPRAGDNPVVWSHVKLPAAGKMCHVLSRVADFGLDYSQRTNKLAHHVVVDLRERPAGGPAWLLWQPGFMQADWDGEPRILPAGRPIRQGDQAPAICTAWQSLTGDAGWAGVLAEAFLADPERPAYLVYEPGMDLLTLLAEAIALLPAERRWDVTFSTYFTNLPPAAVCNWRCVLAGSPEAQQSKRFVQALRIDLCEGLARATGGELVEAARTGHLRSLMPSMPQVEAPEISDDDLVSELELEQVPTELGGKLQGEPVPPFASLPQHPPVIPSRAGEYYALSATHISTHVGTSSTRSRDKIEAMYGADDRQPRRRLLIYSALILGTIALVAVAVFHIADGRSWLKRSSIENDLTDGVSDVETFSQAATGPEIAIAAEKTPVSGATTAASEQPKTPPDEKDSNPLRADVGADEEGGKPQPERSARTAIQKPTATDETTRPAPAETGESHSRPLAVTTSDVNPSERAPADLTIKLNRSQLAEECFATGRDGSVIVFASPTPGPEPAILEIKHSESDSVNWTYHFPELDQISCHQSRKNNNRGYELNGPDASGTRPITTVAETQNGSHDLVLEIAWPKRVRPKDAVATAFRYGIVTVNGALPDRLVSVVLSDRPKRPDRIALKKGKAELAIAAWGGQLPELFIDVELESRTRKFGPATITIPSGSTKAAFARLNIEDLDPANAATTKDASPPTLRIFCAPNSKRASSAVLHFDLDEVQWNSEALKQIGSTIAADINPPLDKWEVNSGRNTGLGEYDRPLSLDTQNLLKDERKGEGRNAHHLQFVRERISARLAPLSNLQSHTPVQQDLSSQLTKAASKVKDIQARTVALVALEQDLMSARIQRVRVYYRLSIGGSGDPQEVDLLRLD